MRLSVIVPVHNGAAFLPRCLAALNASTRLPDEILVVDDGSIDESPRLAALHGAHVLETVAGPRGPAHARNRGAAAAKGDILVFIDADVLVHPDTIARLASVLEGDASVHAVFGSYDDAPAAAGAVSRFKNLLHHYVHQHGRPEASTFWAGCGAIRRDTLLAMGGFAESFRKPSIEDIELGLRLRKAGLRIRLCADIQATHLKRWTLSSLWRTDIFARAVPWTRLILRERQLPADLNLDWRSRLSAVSVMMCAALSLLTAGLLLLGVGDMAPWTGLAAATSLTVSALLNRRLYAFFYRHGKLGFTVSACMLHLTYLLYSSAIFGALLLGRTLTARSGRESNPPASSP